MQNLSIRTFSVEGPARQKLLRHVVGRIAEFIGVNGRTLRPEVIDRAAEQLDPHLNGLVVELSPLLFKTIRVEYGAGEESLRIPASRSGRSLIREEALRTLACNAWKSGKVAAVNFLG